MTGTFERADTKTEERRNGVALMLMLAAYIVDGLDEPVAHLVAELSYMGLLGLIIFGPTVTNKTRVIGFAIIAASLGFSLAAFATGSDQYLGASALTDAAVLGLATIVVLHGISRHETVSLSTVMGAILGYALLAFMFASIFRAVNALGGGAFFNQGDVDRSAYVYFSIITITTVGFGDLTPATDLAQRLVAVEALFGQIILVVFVARLVSLWGQPLPRNRQRRWRPETEAQEDDAGATDAPPATFPG